MVGISGYKRARGPSTGTALNLTVLTAALFPTSGLPSRLDGLSISDQVIFPCPPIPRYVTYTQPFFLLSLLILVPKTLSLRWRKARVVVRLSLAGERKVIMPPTQSPRRSPRKKSRLPLRTARKLRSPRRTINHHLQIAARSRLKLQTQRLPKIDIHRETVLRMKQIPPRPLLAHHYPPSTDTYNPTHKPGLTGARIPTQVLCTILNMPRTGISPPTRTTTPTTNTAMFAFRA
jgi:hypothetical protein